MVQTSVLIKKLSFVEALQAAAANKSSHTSSPKCVLLSMRISQGLYITLHKLTKLPQWSIPTVAAIVQAYFSKA